MSAIFLPFATWAGAKEELVSLNYPGDTPWHEVTNKTSDGAWLREQIPANQQIDSYKDILTSQAFPNQRNESPSSFLKSLFSNAQKSCENVRINGPKEQVDGGYKVAYAQIYCSKQNGAEFGVNMFFKAIGGSDALYVVQREFRVPPTATAGITSFDAGQMQQMVALMKAQSVANTYLVDSVYVCGGQSIDTRCISKP
jgi:hypothetical protein